MKRQWVICGATSAIAEEFAKIAAQAGHDLLLVGKDEPQLQIIACDLQLRYSITCQVMLQNFCNNPEHLIEHIKNSAQELDIFLAHSLIVNNRNLTTESMQSLINVNITSTCQLIHTYVNRQQNDYHLLFLSSVAAVRGRAKNSLYGASKKAIEVYLEGLQQANPHQGISIARLGFIDTKTTYGEEGIFYASPPNHCAMNLWHAAMRKKRLFYHPSFWRLIMAIIKGLPFYLYKRLRF